MVNFKFSFVVVFSFLMFTASSFAQFIKKLDAKEGFINSTIRVFEKDSLGYLWIGSEKSLNRYNGETLKNYDLESITSTESAGIFDILNLNGELYMLGSNGNLLKYNYAQDRLEKVIHIDNKNFLSLKKLDKDKIIIGLNTGFVIYNITTHLVSDIYFPNSFINRKVIVNDNTIYIGSSRGFLVYDYDANTNEIKLKDKVLENNDIVSIGLDNRGRLWIGTETNGLHVKDSNELIQVDIPQLSNKTYAIRSIEFDKKGKAIVSIDRLGLFIINEDLEIINSFSHNVDDVNSISQNSIYEIYIDNENAYWLGLREGGVNIIYPKDNPFSEIKHILNEPNSINNNTIRSIKEDAQGALWFGTENGISKFQDQQWTNFTQHPKLYNTAVLAIDEYKDELLLGTYGEGVIRINKEDGSVLENLLTPKVPLKFVFTIKAFENDLWVAGSDGPLMHYADNKLVSSYPVGLVRTLVAGFDDIYYVGSSTGFHEINKRNRSVRRLAKDEFNNINEIQSLFFDPYNNVIWIGSTSGFYKFHLGSEKAENLSPSPNKEIGTVFSIKKDNTQQLYIGAISGLWKYSVKQEFSRKYNKQDGLSIDEFGPNANEQLSGGRLAFGGPKGGVIFQPLDIEKDHSLGDIFISNFEINGKQPDSLTLPKNINFIENVALQYDQNSISFNFEVIKFHGSKRNKFQYKLEGVDEDWKSVYGNSKITYSNLSPGNYTLQAKAFNPDGEQSAFEKSLLITVKKPFWKSNLAFSMYALLLFLIGYLIYELYKQYHSKRTNDDRIKFFIDVAHDIRTPVSLIQLLVKQLPTQEDPRKSLKLIQRNTENLNEYVSQLLDFQKIDRNQLKLQVSRVNLKDCLEGIIQDFTPILQQKSIDIELDVKNLPVWFDAVKMKRIFYNMISNAIKYSEEGGQINIKAFVEKDHLHVEFKDNGIGIPERQHDLIFKRFTRGTNVSNKGIPGTGIGLMLSKKIVELHRGKILLESKENIGSKFTIVLPNGSQHFKEEELIRQDEANSAANENDVENLIKESKVILLVEDNKELRKAIRSELESSYTILEAENGKEGLLVALSKNPDLIITDVMMPEMNGTELCDLLKTNFKTSHIPIIILSALSDIEDRIRGLKTGADAYVEKPFNTEILKVTIKNLIKSRENVSHLLQDKKVEKKLSQDEVFLSDLIQLIKDNLTSNDFSIDDLCEKMGLSRSNLFRKLKGLIQMSPSDLIIKIKLSKAEELLKQKKHSRISDIAYESGFNDPKYFSTLFKKHYGQTPKEFLDSH